MLIGLARFFLGHRTLHLADRRDETVAFLKARMKPLKISAGEVRALLLKLGNEDEKVWKPAREELEYFDPRAGDRPGDADGPLQ